MTKIKGKVTKDSNDFVFEVELYFSKKPEDLKMEHAWYRQHAKIPQGDHYEMKILSMPLEAEGVKLHIHPLGEERYVCWTQQISDFETAKNIFKVWSLGCVYTILTTIPFENYLFRGEIGGNIEKFESHLFAEFNIKFEFLNIGCLKCKNPHSFL